MHGIVTAVALLVMVLTYVRVVRMFMSITFKRQELVTQFVVGLLVQLVVEMFLPMDNKCIHTIHDKLEI